MLSPIRSRQEEDRKEDFEEMETIYNGVALRAVKWHNNRAVTLLYASASAKYSQEDESNQRPKTPVEPQPSKLVCVDQMGHCPVWVERKEQCKYQSCSGIVKVHCSKCATYLCFSVERNCFLNFHKQ